ncbi:MAG: peptide transporter [candidate division Zixibacteria bacterium]|nr:peptide transporter [candidate division Zixibacteria bacterium]
MSSTGSAHQKSGTSHSDRENWQIVPDDTPYEHGFNVKTLWAALFVGVIMLPGSIYLELVTGKSFAGAAEWVTIIMFIEIGKRLFVKLKPQETIILYWLASGLAASGLAAGAAAGGGPFAKMIWYQYLIQSPQADGLAQHIPGWVAPPRGSEALIDRTFLTDVWLEPIGLALVVAVLGMVSSLSLGYILFRLTADVERLPFPLAPVQAAGATALADSSSGEETWRWRVFTVGTMIGLGWGLIYVVVPTVSSVVLTKTVEVVPIPFADFTTRFRDALPSTPIGIGTDLATLLVGFVLPFWIVTGTFISSICVTFIVNPLLYDFGILHSWAPGMSTIPTNINNTIDFWLSFSSIGTSVVVGLIGIVAAAKALRRRSSPTAETGPRTPPKDRGDIRLIVPIAVWAAATVCFILLVNRLVPDFPLWIAILFGFVWTPFFSYIGARMIGITGAPYGASFPYAREGSFYLSGYKGAAIWFAPVPMFDHSGMVATFRQLELTKTRFGSLVRLSVTSLLLLILFSFIFYSLIWKLAPIPSAAYPYIDRIWPLQATMDTLWIKSTLPGGSGLLGQIIRWDYIGAGALTAGTLYGVLTLFKAPPLLFYGLIAGMGTGAWIHYTLPTFVGAMLGRFYFGKRYGERRWLAYAPVLLAGYGCGLGLIGMASVSFVLIAKSTSQILF